jgi:thiol-disulfide isomerase/thioredoxin
VSDGTEFAHAEVASTKAQAICMTTPEDKEANMKRFTGGGLALSAALLLGMPALAADSGAPAPDFSLRGNNGAVKLSDYKGKTVYLDFWASWCGPCKQSFPWMNAMQAKYAAQGLRVIAVNLDAKPADAAAFLAAVPAQFTVAFDAEGRSAKAYGVKGMPSSVLIDRNGKIISMHAGFNAASRGQLEKTIVDALEAAP